MLALDKNGDPINLDSYVMHQNIIDQVAGFGLEHTDEITVYLKIAKAFVPANQVEIYKPSLQLE